MRTLKPVCIYLGLILVNMHGSVSEFGFQVEEKLKYKDYKYLSMPIITIIIIIIIIMFIIILIIAMGSSWSSRLRAVASATEYSEGFFRKGRVVLNVELKKMNSSHKQRHRKLPLQMED